MTRLKGGGVSCLKKSDCTDLWERRGIYKYLIICLSQTFGVSSE